MEKYTIEEAFAVVNKLHLSGPEHIELIESISKLSTSSFNEGLEVAKDTYKHVLQLNSIAKTNAA